MIKNLKTNYIRNENLYNSTNKKYEKVINYIEHLEFVRDLSNNQTDYEDLKLFDKLKKEVLESGGTANQMLDMIGYNPIGNDKIQTTLKLQPVNII